MRIKSRNCKYGLVRIILLFVQSKAVLFIFTLSINDHRTHCTRLRAIPQLQIVMLKRIASFPLGSKIN